MANSKKMILVASLTIFAKLVAITRQVVLTYCFGASTTTDAYILSQTIPNTLFLLVSSAIGVSFMPIFNQICNEKNDNEAEFFTTRMVNSVLIIASVIVVVTMLFSRKIIFVFASGFDNETARLAANYLRLSIFSIYFIGMCGIFSAYLKIKGDYFSPSIIGIVLSIVEIVSCVLAYYFNDIILAIGITAASMAQFLVVFVAAIRKGYRRHRKIGIWDEYIKRAILMSFPIMLGLGVDEINVIVDKTIASGFQMGSISALNYANTLVSIVHNVISVSINTVLFTEVSRLAAEDNRKEIALRIHESLHNALLLLIPSTVGLIIFAQPIIQIMYERGNFTHESTLLTAGAMAFYALYIIPNGVRLISQSFFYAYGKTKFCMYVGFIAVAVNTTLNLYLSRIMGINGLALATSVGVTVSAIIIFVKLLQENKEINLRKLFKSSIIMVGNSIVMGIVSIWTFRYINSRASIFASLIMAIFIAIIIYFFMSILTKTLDRTAINKLIQRGVDEVRCSHEAEK